MADTYYDDGWHPCHFCGTDVKEGYEDKEKTKRHYLSDCRPDLVLHEIGDTCTWDIYRDKPFYSEGKVIDDVWPEEQCCYAYQNRDKVWTKNHKHFYEDGPM